MRVLLYTALLSFVACGTLSDPPGLSDDPADAVPLDRVTGKPMLGSQARNSGLEARGPSSEGLSPTTEVWSVSRRWYETDAAAGLAWDANSDLTWDQKYSAWIDKMEPVTSDDGSTTVNIITPDGRTLPSPRLECAEMAMFLRTVFASWYELPFFMTAYHGTYGNMHFGHFGVVLDDGSRVPGYPAYNERYQDLSNLQPRGGEAWPSDDSLKSRSLTTLKDDYNTWLGENAYAGAYFDRLLLNKRTGHFLHVLLTSFGSMHIAYAENTFDIAPAVLREGDLLVHRWQKKGIGHVMVVKEVDVEDDTMSAEIMFGSMPRIQPEWYDADHSRSYFLSDDGGGTAISNDGVTYAALGGGLKRWRTPVVKNGRWYNIVPVSDRDALIDGDDFGALGHRLIELKELFGELTFEDELRQTTDRIDLARSNLRMRPASCANRIRREEAFDDLYELLEQNGGKTRAEVDAQYRILDDYVFAKLTYDQAKTCCWNSTTPEMYEIAMDYTRQHSTDDTCVEPTVFKARDGGYALFADFAASTGRADQWRAWSEDETCPAADTNEDVVAESQVTDFCVLNEAPPEGEPAVVEGCGSVTWEGECDGSILKYCDEGDVTVLECAPNSCGYDSDYGYYTCI